MPRRHLPEWREDEEQAFILYTMAVGYQIKPYKGLDYTMPDTVSCIYIESVDRLSKNQEEEEEEENEQH